MLRPISDASPLWTPLTPEDGDQADGDLFQDAAIQTPLFSQFDGAGDDSAAEDSNMTGRQPTSFPRKEMEAWQAFQKAYFDGTSPPAAKESMSNQNRLTPSYFPPSTPGEPGPVDVLEFLASRKKNVQPVQAVVTNSLASQKENTKPNTLASNFQIQRSTAKARSLNRSLAFDDLKDLTQTFTLSSGVPSDLLSMVSKQAREREALKSKDFNAALQAMNANNHANNLKILDNLPGSTDLEEGKDNTQGSKQG